MFNEFNDLPLHPLAIHAAVVLIPLAALLGMLFAVPLTRAWARLPLALVSVAAAGATYVSKESGERFEDVLQLGGEPAALIATHEERANVLFILVLVFAVLAVAAYVVARATSSAAVVNGLAVLLVVGAVAIAVQTYRVGEIGSRAVWNPTGDADFSGSAPSSR